MGSGAEREIIVELVDGSGAPYGALFPGQFPLVFATERQRHKEVSLIEAVTTESWLPCAPNT